MTIKLRSIWILLALLLVSTSARAVLTLEQYQKWQTYNGLIIRTVSFHGIHHFTRSELLNIMATEPSSWLRRYLPFGQRTSFYADDFSGDLFRVEHFYNRQGFQHATAQGDVFPNQKQGIVRLRIKVDEGPPTILTKRNFVMGSDSNAYVDTVRWFRRMPAKVGKRLALPDVQASADTLTYKLKDYGYARALVRDTVITDTVTNTGQVTFTLYPGHYCYLGGTRFVGLKQFAESAARRELTYKEYEPFALHKLELTRQRLVNLQLFTFVSIRPDTSVPGDTLPVVIQVEEGKRYHVSGGVGYDTEQHARVTAQFRDLNFFGQARRFTWDGSLAELERMTQFTLFWPHQPVHVTDLTFIPRYDWQRFQAFDKQTLTNTTILSATPLLNVTAAISNDFGNERRRDRVGNAFAKTKSVYLRSVETASVTWDTRDNPLVPRRGHQVGVTLSESGAFYGTAVRWWRAIAQASVLVPRGRRTTLAARTKFGIMGPLDGTPVTPIEERFFLGGPSDVRGWVLRSLAPHGIDATDTTRTKLVPVGGNMTFNVTGEVRRRVFGPFVAAAFVDAGNVWITALQTHGLKLFPSVGVGLMALTPVGPIRVDIARQVLRNPWGEQNWNLDVSVGALF